MRRIVAAIAACALVCPSLAGAGVSHTGALLWATIDECRSLPTGELVGLRASMPGTGDANEQMFMRFRLQYSGPGTSGWRVLGGSSALVNAGSAAYASRQAGLSFQLTVSTTPGTLVRGVVAFQWRSGSTIVRSARRLTSAGREPSAGAHPPGYSAARCTVS